MEHPLQLITTVDSEGNEISIVCNDAKLSAKEISDPYRTRWQIELFFRWCKQHLVLKRLYRKSQRAVFNQIYIAMITFCLTLLMKKRNRLSRNPIRDVRMGCRLLVRQILCVSQGVI